MTWKVKESLTLLKWSVLEIISELADSFTPICFCPRCCWNDCSSLGCSLVGWSHVSRSVLWSLEFRQFWWALSRRINLKKSSKIHVQLSFKFSPRIRRGNKVFWFPGLMFSKTLSFLKRELPKNVRFPRQFRPQWAQI